MKNLRKLNKTRVDIYELQQYFQIEDYMELVNAVTKLINEGVVVPVKSSKTNGKKPALYNRYTILPIEVDNSKYIEELSYKININLDKTYYLKNISKYKEDRQFILTLSRFLDERIDLLNTEVAINERSFQIWGREKFLAREGGRRILKNLRLSEELLNFYETTEPLAYYSFSKEVPQKLLIIENKDTFYSMRKHMVMGSNLIFGENISTLIYGGGKNIYKTFKDFEFCVEPYLLHEDNEILYLGDLDYEGIKIYEGVYEIFKGNFIIRPFVKGYEFMLDKYIEESISLPPTKEGQNRNIGEIFLNEFNNKHRALILDILLKDKYIPQEILNIRDF